MTHNSIHVTCIPTYTHNMQMERLCEDERMCIQKYAPDSMIGVSNERLYNEIKLLDPTFSMAKLYYDLVRWRAMMASIEKESDALRVYRVLSKYRIINIRGDAVGSVITVGEEDANDIYAGLAALNYTVSMVSTIDEGPYASIQVFHTFMEGLIRALGDIDQIYVSHPIRNIQYRSSISDYEGYGYEAAADVRMKDPYILDHAYDHTLYMAIREVDPTIDMNMLYDVYICKYARENAVRDMYRVWYPYLDTIDGLHVHPSDRVLRLFFNRNSTIHEIMRGLPGWRKDASNLAYAYTGPDIDAMYDRIQTMLRMYYSYCIPRILQMGVQYYDSC